MKQVALYTELGGYGSIYCVLRFMYMLQRRVNYKIYNL